MIRLDKVTVTYPGRTGPALREITLEIVPGQRVAVMGANGSGKSTLALLLAGLIKPISGTMSAPHAALVFQNPENQMVAAVVEKELAFALENRATPQREMETAIERISHSLGIRHLLNSSTTKLSGGEQQKVALGSVMITNPPLLIMDEPDAFLDSPGRVALETALKNIRSQRPDLIEIRITQEIDTARLCDRVIALHKGEIAADDSPKHVLADSDLLRRCRIVVKSDDSVISQEHLAGFFKVNGDALSQINIEGLSFGYPKTGRVILNDLTITFARHEILGVTGPTGSGKSSLGLLLAGILKPSSGSISFIADNHQQGPQVTMALQQPERQFFLPTCREEIAFGPENIGAPLNADDIDGLVDAVGLSPEEFLDRSPHSLSVGEQRRLACAVILALRKPFVVFDEPTAGLDADGIARFVGLFGKLKIAGVGQIIISHDHRLLSKIADRILVMDTEGNSIITIPARLTGLLNA